MISPQCTLLYHQKSAMNLYLLLSMPFAILCIVVMETRCVREFIVGEYYKSAYDAQYDHQTVIDIHTKHIDLLKQVLHKNLRSKMLTFRIVSEYCLLFFCDFELI